MYICMCVRDIVEIAQIHNYKTKVLFEMMMVLFALITRCLQKLLKSKSIEDVGISICFLVTNNEDVYPRSTEFLKIIFQLSE